MRNPEKLLKTLSELIENGILTTKDIKFETSAPFTGLIHIQIFRIGAS